MAVSFQKVGLAGLERVIHNLNKEIQAIEGRSLAGLLLAVAYVRKSMEETPPLIPWDTGNLAGSWHAEPMQFPAGIAVICGFSANYAVWVHEMIGAHFKKPGAGPKFFQSALRRNKNKILEIIRNEAKIRG